MKLAIVQPYSLLYIGKDLLVVTADALIIYDKLNGYYVRRCYYPLISDFPIYIVD